MNTNNNTVFDVRALFAAIDRQQTEISYLTFGTKTEAMDWCKRVALDNGFVLSVAKDGNDKQRLKLRCSRSGHPRLKKAKEDGAVTRNTPSKKCDCPCELRFFQQKSGQWKLVYLHGEHNHAQHAAGALASVRMRDLREDPDVAARALAASKRFRSNALIRDDLRDGAKGLAHITAQDVANFKVAHGITKKAVAEDLLAFGRSKGYALKYRVDETGILTGLFMMRLERLAIARQLARHVILTDATYNTNASKYPLVNFVTNDVFGQDSRPLGDNHQMPPLATFFIGFGFIASESTDDFTWLYQ